MPRITTGSPTDYDSSGNQLAVFNPNTGSTQVLTLTGSSVAATAFSTVSDVIVRIIASANIHVNIAATSVAATTSHMYIPADAEVYVLVPVGYILNAIGTATVYLTPNRI